LLLYIITNKAWKVQALFYDQGPIDLTEDGLLGVTIKYDPSLKTIFPTVVLHLKDGTNSPELDTEKDPLTYTPFTSVVTDVLITASPVSCLLNN
jgi:hypothetical protein